MEPIAASLLVPSVQEMVKNPMMTTVPPRYVRPDQDPPIISHQSLPQVPVVDLQNLVSAGGESMESELEKLHFACKEWGFFQLINHGVSDALVEKIKLEIQEFFNLSMKEKERFWQREGDVEGFGQAFVVSDEQKLDWGDMFAIFTLPKHIRKPHLFPCLPLHLRDPLEEYSEEMARLNLKLLNLMAMAMKMEPSELTEMFEERTQTQSMRMSYYPPCPQPESVIGLGPHSDASGLTILLQVNETEGLQIKKDGKWVLVKPLPNAFVINIGDVLEIVTNGVYRSIEHRAVVNSEKERVSIATFCSPKMDAEIGPAQSIVGLGTPPLFRRIKYEDYIKGFLSRELDGKSFLDTLRIPNVGSNNN